MYLGEDEAAAPPAVQPVDQHGLVWVSVGNSGLLWVIVGCCGLLWVILPYIYINTVYVYTNTV
jgi:hypothetical protein